MSADVIAAVLCGASVLFYIGYEILRAARRAGERKRLMKDLGGNSK